jgi:hypothetical protein
MSSLQFKIIVPGSSWLAAERNAHVQLGSITGPCFDLKVALEQMDALLHANQPQAMVASHFLQIKSHTFICDVQFKGIHGASQYYFSARRPRMLCDVAQRLLQDSVQA